MVIKYFQYLRRIFRSTEELRSGSVANISDGGTVNDSGVAGVEISGQVGSIGKDIVGRDKNVTNFVTIQNDAASHRLEAALDTLGNVKDLLGDIIDRHDLSRRNCNDDELSFWIKEALEPLHAAISEVHMIYIGTFSAVVDLLKSDDESSLNVALQFLTRRHVETGIARENLQGLRSAINHLAELPTEISSYLNECEMYLGTVTGIGVSTPMRRLLDQLSRISDISTLSDHQLVEMGPVLAFDAKREALKEVTGAIHFANERWPRVVAAFYTSKLRLLKRHGSEMKLQKLLDTKLSLERTIIQLDKQKSCGDQHIEGLLRHANRSIEKLTRPE